MYVLYQFYVLDIMATLGKIFELTTAGGEPSAMEAYIQSNLSVRDIEKNKYGEVFTPFSYICELLDQLPARVWRNPALRWLEPASGIGHFCAVIYMRLMDGLGAVFPDRRVRHEHIIRNMLFMVELICTLLPTFTFNCNIKSLPIYFTPKVFKDAPIPNSLPK